MYIDAHTHLNNAKLFDKRMDYIVDFERIGGTMLVNAGADDEYNYNGIEIAKKYYENNGKNFVKATIGFHPYEIICGNIDENNIEQKILELEKLYLKNKEHIVAIGECGIDKHYKGEINIQLQKDLLKMQCELAKKLKLPIVIHSRDDFKSTIDVLKNYPQLHIYVHCWGYGPDEIKTLQNTFENIWIGFDGNISYPNAQNIRDSLKIVDKNNILLETDAPYLPPQKFRGQTNYPSYVSHIYDFVAKELGLNLEELTNVVKGNFVQLYD